MERSKSKICEHAGGTASISAAEHVEMPRLREFAPDLIRIGKFRPLIAHDRAGLGGGVCCCGVTMFLCVYCGRPCRSLWQALWIMGTAGFGTAIGVHFPIGYMSASHLGPAFLGAGMFIMGLALTYQRMIGEVGERAG